MKHLQAYMVVLICKMEPGAEAMSATSATSTCAFDAPGLYVECDPELWVRVSVMFVPKKDFETVSAHSAGATEMQDWETYSNFMVCAALII